MSNRIFTIGAMITLDRTYTTRAYVAIELLQGRARRLKAHMNASIRFVCANATEVL